MRHSLPHARWFGGLSLALGAIFTATFALGLAAARWQAMGVLARPDCCYAALAEGMGIRFSLLLTLLLQPLLYGGRPWHCRPCQRLWLLASAGLGVALALILLLQGSLPVAIELGMGAWLGIEGSGSPDVLGPTIAALRERGLAWIWQLYAGALPAVLALQLLLCVLALKIASGGASEMAHGVGPRLRRCLRWIFASFSFWIAFSSFAFLIWKDQPWLDYRFPATDEVDGYPTYLVPIFTVFPAIFFALQPLLYLGGARPLGWLGRGCLWGSTLVGIVMVGLIYLISYSSSFYDTYHLSRIFWILLEDPALVIRIFVEIPGLLAQVNLERVVPSALVLQLALALSAFWLIPRGEGRIRADFPVGNAD